MTAVEIIALVFIILSIIKLITIAVSPKAWYSPANPIVKLVWSKTSASIFSIVLGAVVLYSLLSEISIVQVFVALVFTFLLAILTVAPDIKEVFKGVVNRLEKENLFAEYWLPLIVWVGLMAWVLWELFFV